MSELVITRPDDWHVHLRQGDALRHVVHHTSRVFRRALVMPNIRVGTPDNGRPAPPVRTRKDAMTYHLEICEAHGDVFETFMPLMTISLTQEATPKEVALAMGWDQVVAAKTYPLGLTTNAEWGIRDFTAPQFLDCLRAIRAAGKVWCVHPETAGEVMHREREFIDVLSTILEQVPGLKVVVEHVTSADMVRFVEGCGTNVAATITAHHLWITLDDVIGGALEPDHFCKPIAKERVDRDALRRVVLEGDPFFFFGSDSAPHTKEAKYCPSGCAGIFSAPVAMPFLAHWLEQEGALDKLEPFVAFHGADFYGLERNEDTLTLERVDPWTVPDTVPGNYTPFFAGKKLNWRVKGLTDS